MTARFQRIPWRRPTAGARSAAPSERCLARHAHHAPFRLRELARRPTACSLEHRARARFDEEHLLAVGELESATAADGHQTRHRLGQTATRSRYGIAAWHWPRRSTACRARRSSGGPVPAAPMADTAIWSTLSWPLANVVSARAYSIAVWLVCYRRLQKSSARLRLRRPGTLAAVSAILGGLLDLPGTG